MLERCALAHGAALPALPPTRPPTQEVRSVSEAEVQRLEHTAMLRELRDKATQLTTTQGRSVEGGVAPLAPPGTTH